MIITRTPFRISLFGGGTDYPEWYKYHGGLVIGMAINKYSYILARKLPQFFNYKTRISYSKIETVSDNRDIEHRLVNSCIQYLGMDEGLEICHYADLPSKTGIGSSSSFTVGLVNALNCLQYKQDSKQKLAETAIHIERTLLQETGGHQDQIWAAFGGINEIIFDHRGFSVNRLILRQSFEKELENSLLLVYTGIERVSGQVAATYIKNIDRIKEKMIKIRELADEAISCIRHEDIIRLGLLLRESWEQKKSQSEGISNPQIDSIFNIAMQNGAIGGKLLGAGGGGFLLFVVEPQNKSRLTKALAPLTQLDVEIDHEGSKVLYVER